MSEKTITFRLNIFVKPDGEEFYAYCKELNGLHVSGETSEEAVANARNGAIAYLATLVKHGDPIPLGCLAEEPESIGQLASQLFTRMFSSRRVVGQRFVEELQLAA